MLQNLDHELGEVRSYTFLRNVCGKGSASALGHGLSRPCTTTMGVPAPRLSPTLRGLDSRQSLPALDLDSEGPCPSETSRAGASAPRHHGPPRRGIGELASVSPLDPDGASPHRPAGHGE